MNETRSTVRHTLEYTLHDLENSLRVNQFALDQAQRDVVSFQAKVNHDKLKIAQHKEMLEAMDGEK
jgi:hypothetical protein